jgi:hypothetical protein
VRLGSCSPQVDQVAQRLDPAAGVMWIRHQHGDLGSKLADA